MAIDTRDKRASVLAHGARVAHVFTNPDGSPPTAPDRAHIIGIYRGFSFATAGSRFNIRSVEAAGMQNLGGMRIR